MAGLAKLLQIFRKLNPDVLWIESGKKITIEKGGKKQEVGNQPMPPEGVQKLVNEVLGNTEISLKPVAKTLTDGGEAFDLEVRGNGSSILISIRRPPPKISVEDEMSLTGSLGNMSVESDGGFLDEVPASPAPVAPPVVTPPAQAPPPISVSNDFFDQVKSKMMESGPMVSASESIDQIPGGAPAPAMAPPGAIPAGYAMPYMAQPTKVDYSNAVISPSMTPGLKTQGPQPIDEYLKTMISYNASDLHLTSGTVPVARVDGEIQYLQEYENLTPDAILKLMGGIMSPKAKEDFIETMEADFAYEIQDLGRFRVNMFYDLKGVGVVIRQIPINILTVEELGLPKSILDLCHITKGMVVVTGPTGSGKSTTLAAMIHYINENRKDHIITIEDPVEFVHQNIQCLVNQREIGTHTKSFKNALRAALREDPDIILVGEMRDLETISIAVETAVTGHLVFGTLHTNTAISTVDRLIDQFPGEQQQQIRVMLSEALRGVIAQTLCKKREGGRVAALEILMCTDGVSNLIREGKTYQLESFMQTGKKHGMVTLNQSLFELLKSRTIDAKEAYFRSVDKESLLKLFKDHGMPTNFKTEKKHKARAT